MAEKPCAPCSAFTPRDLAIAAKAPSWSKLELKVFFKVSKERRTTSSLQRLPSEGRILEWANFWHEEAARRRVTVPKFVAATSEDESDVSAELKG